MRYVYAIVYDGEVSTEAYDTPEKAMDHLEHQGYHKVIGWVYEYDYTVALIMELKVV